MSFPVKSAGIIILRGWDTSGYAYVSSFIFGATAAGRSGAVINIGNKSESGVSRIPSVSLSGNVINIACGADYNANEITVIG